MTDLPVKERIGLFGGSFDPPHLGHLEIARRAREECSLDRVILIPCRQSPHKSSQTLASGEDRLAMLKLCFNDLPWSEVSSIELDRPDPSFSWQTVASLAKAHPEAELFWILGHDQWKVIDTWSRPDELRRQLTFIVLARHGDAGDPREGFRAHFIDFHHPAVATDIRHHLASGDFTPASEQLHPAVVAYIQSQGLYLP
jgi:nicotinate-nucleotide adenylyltransferase